MTTSAQKCTTQNRTLIVLFYPSNFNGKEKDHESGFHYYGARYYWSEVLTGWLSVDPMADKHPGISPYAYCAWNPIKLVDPNGEDIYRLDTETGSLTLYRRTKDNKDIIEAGTTTGIGRAKHFKTSSTKEFSKGILNGRDGQDFSQTGFVTCGYGIDTFVIISKKEGSILYGENGRVSPYVGHLPTSVYFNY